MLQWITNNVGTILVSLALIGLVAWVIFRIRKDKKQGKSSCGCNCGCCSMSELCHKQS